MRLKNNDLTIKMKNALALGTVQLGMPYGRANVSGQPDETTAIAMLRRALELGVTHLDTAAAYGHSETLIGKALAGMTLRPCVATKLLPFSDIVPEHLRGATRECIDQSRQRLGVEKLDILLLHRWTHRHIPAIWETLKELQELGVIERLGASVGSVAEAEEAVADPDITFIQLPVNVLDGRWEDAGLDVAMQQRKDLTVQARSVLLQGILAAPVSRWPQVAGVSPENILKTLRELTLEFRCESVAELCLSYVRGLSWVDSMVMGMETMAQLEANVALFRQPPLTPEQCAHVRAVFSGQPEKLLNPALWR